MPSSTARFTYDEVHHTGLPTASTRWVPPLGRWRRFDEDRTALMRAQLERIVATPSLSKDVYEQALKSLG